MEGEYPHPDVDVFYGEDEGGNLDGFHGEDSDEWIQRLAITTGDS